MSSMLSTGLLTEGVSELNAPMVYLAPDRHAFLVLGDGDEPLITWSKSFKLACEQADINGGTVVAVPIVRDSSWRKPHRDDPTQVPFPAAKIVRIDRDGPAAGYPLGGRRQSSAVGWSSARPDVVGQGVERVTPFGDEEAPQLPADPEEALRDAFNGDDEAVSAFHAPSSDDIAVLEAVRDALA